MQITSTQTATTLPARTAVAADTTKAESRLAYIDIIRLVLTILVIMVHAAVTYGAFGDWTYQDKTLPDDELSGILLSLFVFTSQSFFMGLFFFFAGYFTPGSYDRKGLTRFWKDRLLRLGIPLLLYTLFLSRVPNYINMVANWGLSESFWKFSASTFWTEADAGPTWFLFALLVFSLGYTLWRAVSGALRLDLAWTKRLPAPGTKALLGLALVISAAMFAIGQGMDLSADYDAFGAINLMPAFMPTYILLFTGGMLAYRSGWLASISSRLLRPWAWFSAALIVILPVYLIGGGAVDGGLDPFLGGFTWQCAGLSLWFGLACVAISTTLTLWLRDLKMPHSKLAGTAGPNNYAAYLIHPLVLVPLTYGMSFIALPALVKFALASLLTVIVCYALAQGLRRLPGARAIL